MKNLLHFLISLLLVILYSGCNKEENAAVTPITPYGWDFFPVDSGISRYYTVDSVYWDEFTGVNDTVSYQLKEVIAGTFTDNQGRPAQRIERFKLDSTGNWVIYKVWSAVKTQTRAEVVEDNIRYIKLSFPCSTGVSWNGNAYNTIGTMPYEYTFIGAATLNGISFNESASVLQDDAPFNLLEDAYTVEKYAINVGLYFKKQLSLEFNPATQDTVSGYIYTEQLTSITP